MKTFITTPKVCKSSSQAVPSFPSRGTNLGTSKTSCDPHRLAEICHSRLRCKMIRNPPLRSKQRGFSELPPAALEASGTETSPTLAAAAASSAGFAAGFATHSGKANLSEAFPSLKLSVGTGEIAQRGGWVCGSSLSFYHHKAFHEPPTSHLHPCPPKVPTPTFFPEGGTILLKYIYEAIYEVSTGISSKHRL